MLFKDTWLKQWLIKSLDEIWYTEATPIQKKVIPAALQWKNIVWQAQTWTWKTAAFLLPVLHNIDTNNKDVQVLILAPTRELVLQICNEIYFFTKYYRVPVVALYGWVSPVNQKKALKKYPRIIVATPWRFMDLLWQWLITLSTIKTLVLDEVDRMLDMGFIRDIIKVWKQLVNLNQTFTFSATMNDNIKRVIDNNTDKYDFIKVWEEITVKKIDHSYTLVENKDKFINLTKLLNTHKNAKILVFVNKRVTTNIIYNTLLQENHKVWLLNWSIQQSKRNSTLQWYIKWKFKILVTTDVAARWLNMESVELVINFDIPNETENYIHRIWRTWRAGKNGKAIMFVSKKEKPNLAEIETICWWKIKLSDYKSITDIQWTYTNLFISTESSQKKLKKYKAKNKNINTDANANKSVNKKKYGTNPKFKNKSKSTYKSKRKTSPKHKSKYGRK